MTQTERQSVKEESNRDNRGLPLRRLELALNQIIDSSIPFHLKAIEKHKQLIERYRERQQWDQLLKEQINGLQSVQRLKANVRELESLGHKVMECEQCDRQLVCHKVISIKTNVCSVVEQFIEANHVLMDPLMGLDMNNKDNNYFDDNQRDNCVETEEIVSNLEIMSDLNERKHTLISWQNLRKELNDLNEMFNTIMSSLMGQKERVNQIEDNIIDSHENVVFGAQHLSKASALKSTFVPITAGLLGGAVFGPIGMLVGFKFSGIASAIGASIITYSGVKMIQKKSISSDEIELVSTEEKKINEKKNE